LPWDPTSIEGRVIYVPKGFQQAGLAGPPDDFGKLIAKKTQKWGKVIRAANIGPD
jgi:hypothetical protein